MSTVLRLKKSNRRELAEKKKGAHNSQVQTGGKKVTDAEKDYKIKTSSNKVYARLSSSCRRLLVASRDKLAGWVHETWISPATARHTRSTHPVFTSTWLTWSITSSKCQSSESRFFPAASTRRNPNWRLGSSLQALRLQFPNAACFYVRKLRCSKLFMKFLSGKVQSSPGIYVVGSGATRERNNIEGRLFIRFGDSLGCLAKAIDIHNSAESIVITWIRRIS